MHQIRPLKTKTPEDWPTKLADIKERCPKSSRERHKIERISLGMVDVDFEPCMALWGAELGL